jgi:hypothetical protein
LLSSVVLAAKLALRISSNTSISRFSRLANSSVE